MRRSMIVAAALVAMLALPALPASGREAVSLQVSPNPAALGQRVSHSVTTAAYGRLEVWVSAKGFGQPGFGTLPSGAWTRVCCPSQTAGTAAWHYRSGASVAPGTYRFGADAVRAGSYLSSAALGFAVASVWVRVVTA
jgi:hypothetical protein